MGFRPAVAVALAVLVVLAIPSASSRPDAGGIPRPLAGLSALVTDQSPLPAGRDTVPLPPATPVRLALSLRFSNASRLSGLLANLSDPSSPEYRAFLSPTEFRHEFAPSPAELRAAELAIRAAGGSSPSVAPGRLGVFSVMPAKFVSSLLGVSLVQYPGPGGRTVYTAVGAPTLPPSLAGIVTGVGGLSDAGNGAVELASSLAHAEPVDQFVLQKSTGDQWAVGSDYAKALGVTPLWPGPQGIANATYPSSVSIATLLASAYNSTLGVDLPPFDPAVVDAYFNATLGPSWPHPSVTGVPVPIAGVPTPPEPGSFGTAVDSTEDEAENSLDLEMAGSLAPGAALYTFYFAGSQMDLPLLPAADLADDFAADLASALNYSYAPSHPLAVVSGSFGLPELNDSLWDSGLEWAKTLGVTIACASGDAGDAPPALTGRSGQWPEWPATATFGSTGAISVGGASVTLGGSATSNATARSIRPAYDPNVTSIASAAAWYQNLSSGLWAGSEGGASLYYAEPRWQFDSAAQPAIVNATVLEGAGALGRAGPDLALPANNTIAYIFANSTGTIYLSVLGGTSVAAPLLAGLLASVVAVESVRAGHFAPLGFIDPELYRIASYYASSGVRATPAETSDPFLDVVRGANYVFSAAPGWDAVTGWGIPNATELLAADENATVRGYVYTGPTPGLPHHAAPFLTAQTEYLLIASGALIAIALVIIAARPSAPSAVARPPRPSEPDDLFGELPQGARPGGPTFSCPYCGGERPAEPVRCPHCGTL